MTYRSSRPSASMSPAAMPMSLPTLPTPMRLGDRRRSGRPRCGRRGPAGGRWRGRGPAARSPSRSLKIAWKLSLRRSSPTSGATSCEPEVAEVAEELVPAREPAGRARRVRRVAAAVGGPVADVDRGRPGARLVHDGEPADDVAVGLEAGARGHVLERAVAAVPPDGTRPGRRTADPRRWRRAGQAGRRRRGRRTARPGSCPGWHRDRPRPSRR